ncbi:MAG: hypothetical protein HYZ27_02470, partial [Deltaproteobacteria bacterium]|nr:hypothetical protein [Deltaproteobacteria bacterium]
DCAVRASQVIDASQILTAHLAGSRPAPALVLELVDIKARTVLARADGVMRPGNIREDVAAVWNALLAKLAPPVVAAAPPPPEAPPAPPEPQPPAETVTPPAPDAPDPPPSPAPTVSESATSLAAAATSQPAEEWMLETADPLVLHAEALALRLDGKLAEARQTLRRALALLPQSDLIAFDLAKLALSGANDAFDSDVAPFLDRAPATPDAHLLRAHILLRRGNRGEAATHLRATLDQRGDSVEALRLQHILAPVAAAPAAPTWSFRVGTGAQADSNVAVLPEDVPGPGTGVRAVFDGSATVRPVRGPVGLEATARANMASQLNDRDDAMIDPLADIGTAALSARVNTKLGATSFTGELGGSQVMLDRFAETFMRDAGARLEIKAALPVELGAYAGGAWRDFAFANSEDSAADRDGPRVEGGLLVGQKLGPTRARARVGAQAELAQGSDQKEWGPQADLSLAVRAGELSVDVAFAYHMRDYFDATLERREHRLTPGLRLAYSFTDLLGAYASYTLMKSLSENYPFTRHLGAAGVFATW